MFLNRLSSGEIDIQQILYEIRMLVVQINQNAQFCDILQLVASKAKSILESDRLIIYRFLPDGGRVIEEEAVNPKCIPIQGQLNYEPCLEANCLEQYQAGEVSVIEDTHTQSLDNSNQELLARLQVRSQLAIPILVSCQHSQGLDENSGSCSHLWGLLIAHQCSSPRQWNPWEIEFLQLLSTQLAIIIQQRHNYNQLWQLYQSLKDSSVQPQNHFQPTNTDFHPNCRHAIIYDKPQESPKQTASANQILASQLYSQQTHQGLRTQVDLLHAMTDSSLLAFFVVDNRTDEILYFNHRFCEIWGLEHLESKMRSGELKNNDIIPECLALIKDVAIFAESCQPLQSQNNHYTIEDEIVFVDGRTIRRLKSQIHDSADKYFGRLYIFEDISERKHLEKSWLLSDYSFECIGICGTWIDRHAKVLRVNEAACRLLGYTRAELESMYVYQLDPDFPQQAWADHWQELKAQKCMNFISHHRTKDGQLIPVEITLNYVEFLGEEYNFAFARDITEQLAAVRERSKAEAALKESEQRYRSVISAMAEGIILQQADGRISACNDSVQRILGLTSDQIMGCTSIEQRWQAIHEDGSPFPQQTHPATATLQTGQPQFNVIMGIRKPDSRLSWISINSQPLFQPDESTPYAVVTSFTDITDLKQAQQALQQRMEQERMIYAISAHIRQSLDLDRILNTTVADIRHFLQSDRVIIYRFERDGSGVVVTESVLEPWQSLLNLEFTNSYFVETTGQSSEQGMMRMTSNIYTAGFSSYHVQLLEQLQVKAELVVPILQNNHLWGLLIVHHCRDERQWQLFESELLQQLATQLAIAIQQSELYQQLQTANEQLQNLAMADALTSIANRRHFDLRLNCVWQQLLREQGYLSLLLCDIDYFKHYNDTYGHAAGDDCLCLVAEALQQTLKRSTDLAARYGGEEFAVVLPHTNTEGAIQVAQQIHQAIQSLNILHNASPVNNCVTLSIGIATVIPASDLVPLDLIEAADRALYQAKAHGRNRSFVL